MSDVTKKLSDVDTSSKQIEVNLKKINEMMAENFASINARLAMLESGVSNLEKTQHEARSVLDKLERDSTNSSIDFSMKLQHVMEAISSLGTKKTTKTSTAKKTGKTELPASDGEVSVTTIASENQKTRQPPVQTYFKNVFAKELLADNTSGKLYSIVKKITIDNKTVIEVVEEENKERIAKCKTLEEKMTFIATKVYSKFGKDDKEKIKELQLKGYEGPTTNTKKATKKTVVSDSDSESESGSSDNSSEESSSPLPKTKPVASKKAVPVKKAATKKVIESSSSDEDD